MKCLVCSATYSEGEKCPQCGHGPFAQTDTRAILKAREQFLEKSAEYNPSSRVSTWDKARPWVAFLLGFVIFMFWLRACSTMGWKVF